MGEVNRVALPERGRRAGIGDGWALGARRHRLDAASAGKHKARTESVRGQKENPPVRATKGKGGKSSGLPVHVLIRVRSEDGQTITAHRKMIVAKGSAVLGKIGQGLGSDFIGVLNGQIAGGVPTYLFLTTREGWNGPYVTYQCRVKSVDRELPKSKRAVVPKYYSSEYANVKTWFEILSLDKMSKWEMNQIFVVSSGREIMSVINSSATVFRVSVKRATAGA